MTSKSTFPEYHSEAGEIHRIFHFLAQYEIWLALLLVFLSMLWVKALPWVVIGMAILSLVRWFDQKRWSRRTPVDWLVLTLAVISLLSLGISPLPEVTAPQVYRLLTGLALFYVIVNWLYRPGRIGWITVGVACLPPMLAVMAMFSVEWPAGKLPLIPASFYDSFSILMQDTIHPNVLAGNLAVVLPISLAIFLHRWDFASDKPGIHFLLKLLLGVSLVFSVAILFLTQSRGAWLAFGFATILIIILRFRWGWLAVVVAGICSLVAGYYFINIPWLQRWLYSSYMIGDLASRMELWARGVLMLENFFFTGIGMGTFAQTTNAIYPWAGESPPHVHNLFLQVGVDLGVPGLLAWLSIFILVTRNAWSLYHNPKSKDNHWLNSLGLGLLASQAALALHGMFDSVTWGMVRPAPLVWGLWGVCLGLYLMRSRHSLDGAKNGRGVV